MLFLEQQRRQQLHAVTWQSGASSFRATPEQRAWGWIGEKERENQAAAGILAADISEKLSRYLAGLKDHATPSADPGLLPSV